MVKYLVMDVDGTLTDGKVYIGNQGELFKSFNIKDGAGIFLILPKMGVTPVIITARESRILENRCKELGIRELKQGSKDKLKTLMEVLEKNLDGLNTVAYAGDDLPDIPCMEEVRRAGGIVVCPSDAIPEVKALADFVSGHKAGDGAIRDCINYLAQYRKQNYDNKIRNVVDVILSGNYSGGSIDGNPYTIQEYITREEKDCVLESHRNHIDVQYMVEGCEEFKLYMATGLTGIGGYNSRQDTEYWDGGIVTAHSVLIPGSIVVVYSGQPHKGSIMCGKFDKVKKLVCKIKV